MTKQKLCIISPYRTLSGYGQHSRLIIRALLQHQDRYDISLISTPWGSTPMTGIDPNDPMISLNCQDNVIREQPDISIQITIPSECQRIGKKSILISAVTEADVCPPSFIEGANRSDLIIVPSKFTAAVLANTMIEKRDNRSNQVVEQMKVNRPIEVLFEGIDTEVYSKNRVISSGLSQTLNSIKESFCYLFVGHWLQGNLFADRKDVGALVHTFLRSFMRKSAKNRPALILKTSGAGYSITERDQIIDKIWQIKELIRDQDGFKGEFPSIYLINGELAEEQMNELYNHSKVKSMVTFAHAEGYGLPLAEFSTTGKPIILPAYSGPLDFISPDHHVFLPVKPTKVDNSAANEWIPRDSSWASVNYTFAGQVLVDVMENYSKYLEKSRKSPKYIKDNFSLTKMSEKLLDILETHCKLEKMPELKALKLPSAIGESSSPELKLPKLIKLT